MENIIPQDGIVNFDEFYKTSNSPKVLFILKETNNYNKNLSQFLRNLFVLKQVHKKGQSFQMWHTIAKWAYGIINDFPAYNDLGEKKNYLAYLQKIAVINLKKEPGNAKSINTIIREHAIQNSQLIINQIDEIKPKYIIACGTFKILCEILKIESNISFAQYNEIIIIKMRHPNRANQKKTYVELQDHIITQKSKSA